MTNHPPECLLQIETSVRPISVWCINDRPVESELSRQLEQFAEKGLRGVVLSPRPGRPPVFTPGQWRTAVAHCCREAARLGLEIWLHVGPAWSGVPLPPEFELDARMQAGSITTRIHRNLREGESFEWSPGEEETPILVVGLRQDGAGNVEIWSPDRPSPFPLLWTCPEGEWNVTVFVVSRCDSLDILSSEAVRYFASLLLEPHDSQSITGLIVRRPPLASPGALPWSDAVPEKFLETYGYPVYEALPAFLVGEGDDSEGHRCAYWATVSLLYRDSFVGVLKNICRQRGWDILFGDETTEIIPGLEPYSCHEQSGLGRETEFLVRKRTTSEFFLRGGMAPPVEVHGGLARGWAVCPADILGDVHHAAAAGAVRFIAGTAVYSLLGGGDCEPGTVQSYQATYWPWYRMVADYMSRLGRLLSHGHSSQESVLVVLPSAAFFAGYRLCDSGKNPTCGDSVDVLLKTISTLLAHGISFELVSEGFLHRAEIEGARITFSDEGNPIHSFSCILVPACKIVSSETERFLQLCHECGAEVLYVGMPPQRVWSGRGLCESALAHQLSLGPDTRGIVDRLRELGQAVPVEQCNQGVAVIVRSGDWGSIVCFVARADTGEAPVYRVRLGRPATITHVNLYDGGLHPVDCAVETGDSCDLALDLPAGAESEHGSAHEFSLHLPPGQVQVYLVTEKPIAEVEEETPPRPARVITRVELAPTYLFFPLSTNVLPLQEWRLETHQSLTRARRGYVHRASFEIADFRGGLRLLCPESIRAQDLEIQVNGQTVRTFEPGKRLDRLILEADITRFVHAGRNEISVTARNAAVGPGHLCWICWLEGDFAVRRVGNREVIFAPATCLRIGSWTSQGYPYYSGSAVYRQRVIIPESMRYRRFFLRFESIRDFLEVRVNRLLVATLLSPPWECEITQAAVLGENKFEFVVTNSLCNALEATPRPSGLLGPVTLEAR